MTFNLPAVDEALKRDEYPVELLNALMLPSGGWKRVNTRKEHTDQFGDKIARGDVYYHRHVGRSIMDVAKLSTRSMDKMLRVVFEGDFVIIGHAQHMLKLQDERFKKLIERLDESPE